MTLISLTAYAAAHGVKKQSAAEWKARGYLVMRDGLVDVEASDEHMRGAGKGRFRVKAHGGKRQAGVRGVPDRPGLTPPAPPPPAAWEGWHPVGNPNTMSTDLRAAVAAGDDGAIEEALETVQYSQWHDACTAAGWDRWHTDVAASVAADLGIPDRVADVQEVLHRHVRARLQSFDLRSADLEDPRLHPR